MRLRSIILKLSKLAEHRLEQLRLDPSYKQIDDPRRQLRFVEAIEKNAHLRQKATEKEQALSKTKAKDKDMREKAKQVWKNFNLNKSINYPLF